MFAVSCARSGTSVHFAASLLRGMQSGVTRSAADNFRDAWKHGGGVGNSALSVCRSTATGGVLARHAGPRTAQHNVTVHRA